MSHSRPLVLLVQLPIPPPGPQAIQGNIPLAAGYLKLFARKQGLEESYRIEILPPRLANDLGDQGLAEELLAREPWMVGFTCYLWNIDRTLWLAQRLKQARPGLFIVLGGPEITADNGWVLEDAAVDYAVIGEGEQTFADLLRLHADQAIGGERAGVGRTAGEGVPGLWSRKNPSIPPFRRPLGSLDEVSSPYLADILDAADERTMFLETVRGCVFKCKFCYYPKSYDAIYFVSRERIAANLEHARQRGVREVVLLDPTLNQRRDFAEFLRLLAEHNPDRRFTYFGELRAEGIHAETARLLKEANFSEVEIGLPVARSAGPDLDGPQGQPQGVRARRESHARCGHRRPRGPDSRAAGRYGRLVPPQRGIPAALGTVYRGAGLQSLDPSRHGLSTGRPRAWVWRTSRGRPTTCSARRRSRWKTSTD